MPIYIALLRGVNVGQNILKMERLRELCAELKLKNARTLLQSGNIVFEAHGTAAHWTATLERKLAGETRLPVSVIVRTADEFAKIVAANPFLRVKGLDPVGFYVTFLQRVPAKAALEVLRGSNAGSDRFERMGSEIFLHCRAYHETKLSNNAFEKLLGVRATTRNWNTVRKLCEMTDE